MIEIRNLSKSFTNSSGQTDILHNISLTIEKGQWYTIFGPSCTGKTTFLGCLAGLLSPTTGEVLYDGIQFFQLSDKARSNYRRKHIGFVYQNVKFLQHYSIIDNVVLPFIHDEPKKTLYPKAMTLLEQVGICNELFERFPEDLSVEERQRVAIARALLGNPSILICDEPTGNLDVNERNGLLDLLSFYRAQGQTIIMVTRDEDATKYSDYIYKLEDKQLVEMDRHRIN
ncbi:ABC transporter ATP-binding protein [Bacillus ndiopicus]|uniref:ABC transporter ATP-binding protein n=1 Tax=Bacillus ndiopicus TaxID=1347368 RepID=UPI0005A68572|nr:ABC transporter ATP-binding protein [Bacillus ndiopicus]